MKPPADGSKEADVKRLRLMREAQASRTKAPAPPAAQPRPKEIEMKKPKKKPAKPAAKKRGRSEASANLKAAKKSAPKAAKSKGGKAPIPALDVANFMARAGGASMAELVEKFGIKAHPMRAKIHYVRHQMEGWAVDMKDGRYHATGPSNGV